MSDLLKTAIDLRAELFKFCDQLDSLTSEDVSSMAAIIGSMLEQLSAVKRELAPKVVTKQAYTTDQKSEPFDVSRIQRRENIIPRPAWMK
jgi:hypothetical protein